jgi:hypothetical protein
MQKLDLYSLLWTYANKAHTPTIKISIFFDFIEKYAREHVGEQPEWEVWARNVSAKFWDEVPSLVDAGKCAIQGALAERFIFLTQYYTAMIALAYKQENGNSLSPFPDERGLKIQIPDEQVTVLRPGKDFSDYLEKTESSNTPIVKLDLSEELGSILILDSMIPYKLLEVAFSKIRFYLLLPGNYDLVLQKLTALSNKEEAVQEMLNLLIQGSNTLIEQFEKNENSSYFLHVCEFIRNELVGKKAEFSFFSDEDITLLQTLAIIKQFYLFFNAKAKQHKAKEQAFEELIAHFTHPPYFYTLGELIKLDGSNGKPLLEYYSSKELDDFLAAKTNSPPDQVPELLTITDAKKEQLFVLKTVFPRLCVQHLQEARATIKNTIIRHWLKLLQQYQIEPAMEDDREFEKTLIQHLKLQMPTFAEMIKHKRLSLLFYEIQSNENEHAEFIELFDKQTAKLLDLNEILLVKRQKLLSDTRSRLPFWYSSPLLLKLIKVLNRKETSQELSVSGTMASSAVKKEKPLTFWAVCTQLEGALLPPGQTLDQYLTKLWDRWAKLVRDEDRKNLREDVNSLVRDRIRRTARLVKPIQINEDYLSQITSELIKKSPALRQLQNNSLELYIKLYLIKLLKSIPR